MEESSRIERAKQFLAFDALKGLQEELRKKEEEIEKEFIKKNEGNQKEQKIS